MQRTGLSNGTIIRTLQRLGAQKGERAKPRIRDDAKAKAIAACASGTKIADAATEFGLSVSTLDRALRAANVSLPIGRPTICELNHAAFDVLTPEILYWLGFLFTDGSCYVESASGERCISVQIQERDRAHLEKFRIAIGSTHSIHPTRSSLGSNCVAFKIRSEPLAEALLRVGMTATGKPNNIPSAALRISRDFWRGCMDGDGSITWSPA